MMAEEETWHVVARVSDMEALGDEEAMGVEVQGQRIALCRHAGAFHALGNVCTHQFALLSDGYVEDGQIECPLHQARFDLKTGQALCAPATAAVKVYRTRIADGELQVRLDAE